MTFADELPYEVEEKKNNVYIKWIQPYPKVSTPFFEVNRLDGTKSEHKVMKDMKLLSVYPHVYVTEEWGEKKQYVLELEDVNWEKYALYCNWNSISRSIANCLASVDNIEKVSIAFLYNWEDFTRVVVYINGSTSPASWAFTWEDYKNRVEVYTNRKWQEERDYDKLDADIMEKLSKYNKSNVAQDEVRDLQAELEVEEEKNKKTKAEKKSSAPEDDLPF